MPPENIPVWLHCVRWCVVGNGDTGTRGGRPGGGVSAKKHEQKFTLLRKDVIVRWIRPPSATTMGIYPMAGARPSKPITELQMGSLPGWFGYAT